MAIEEIHEEVFLFLLKKRETDPSLRYNLRYQNDEAMKRGHWFHGETDRLLFVTFWDATTVMFPTILFFISEEGKSELWIDERRKDGQLDLWKDMAAALGLRKVNSKWTKSYPNNKNYLENLDDFIKKERPYINSFLELKGRIEDYPPFPEGKFLRNLAKVETIRRNKLESIENSKTNNQFAQFDVFVKEKLTINCLQFTNINAFKSLNINFDKRVTCFLGGNGSGKTTILRGIVLGLVGSQGFKASDLNLLSIKEAKGSSIKLQKEGFIDVLFTYKNESLKNTIEFQTDKEAVEASFKADNGYSLRDDKDDKYLKTLIVGFSQQTQSDKHSDTNGGFSPKLSDVKALISNNVDNRYEEFRKWLEDLIRADAKEDREHNKAIIDDVFDIINSAISGHKSFDDNEKDESNIFRIELTSESDTYVKTVANPNGIPMRLLSQGYRNVLAWLGFFMKRMVEYRDSLPFDVPSFTKLPAICLIDEIDTYLHPDWQYTILSGLVEHFPNVQFFITSHSPFVLTSVPSETIAIFELTIEDGQVFCREKEDINLFGADANRATGTISSERKTDFQVAFDILDSKIENNELEEAKILLATDNYLSKMDSQNDAHILKAERMIRTKELLKKAIEEGAL